MRLGMILKTWDLIYSGLGWFFKIAVNNNIFLRNLKDVGSSFF
jgi:hypothetical protein